MKTEFDKIYCINFLESPERRAFMKMQFDALGLDVTFFNAINFKRILHGLNIKGLISNKIIDLKVFGCSISHYSVIKEAQLLGYEKILIFEDDMCFLKDAKIIEYYFNDLPNDWNCIKYFFSLCELAKFCPKHLFKKELSLYISYNKTQHKKINKFINYNELPEWFSGTNSAGAYALDKNGIDYVVNEYEKNFLPADTISGIFSEINKTNFSLNCYFPNKIICAPDVSFSKGFIDISKKIIPTMNCTPIFKFIKDDFFRPEKFLKSTIASNR